VEYAARLFNPTQILRSRTRRRGEAKGLRACSLKSVGRRIKLRIEVEESFAGGVRSVEGVCLEGGVGWQDAVIEEKAGPSAA